MPMNPGAMDQSEQAATLGNWIAVAVIAGGTIIGGVALIEWMWPLFWAGVGVFFAGIGIAWATKIMSPVSVWNPPN